MSSTEIIGQIFGGIAVIIAFITYQMRDAKKILLIQMGSIFALVIHYFLLAAYPGMAMNAVGLFRNIAYFYRDRMPKKLATATPVFCVIVMVTAGLLSWQDTRSLLAISGLSISAACMAFSSAQNIRKSILVSSPLILVYDIFVFSIGGMILETASIISAIIGIICTNRAKKEKNTD